jgi:hypothetical protein
MKNAQNPKETLEFLVTAFIVAELYTEKFGHLLKFTDASKQEKEQLEEALIGKLKERAVEKISGYLQNNDVYDVVLAGQTHITTIYNILKYPYNAMQMSEEHPFSSTSAFTLEDFLE